MRLLQFDVPPSGAQSQLVLSVHAEDCRTVKFMYKLPPAVQTVRIDNSALLNSHEFWANYCEACSNRQAIKENFLRDIVYTQTPELLNLIAPELNLEPIKNIRSVGERGYLTYCKRLKTWRNKLYKHTRSYTPEDWECLFRKTNTIDIINEVYDRRFNGITPCAGGLERYTSNLCPRKEIDIHVGLEQYTADLPTTLFVLAGYCYYYLHEVTKDRNTFYSRFPMNCYPDGRICWGRNFTPRTSREALNLFWGSKFNRDLGRPEDLVNLGKLPCDSHTEYSKTPFNLRDEVVIDIPNVPTAVFLSHTPQETSVFSVKVKDSLPAKYLCVHHDIRITSSNELLHNGSTYKR